jgi:hypothetical protein
MIETEEKTVHCHIAATTGIGPQCDLMWIISNFSLFNFKLSATRRIAKYHDYKDP